MRTIILTLLILVTTNLLIAQDSTLELSRQHYVELKNFLYSQKNNVDEFANIKSHWNSKSYRQDLEEWFTITKKNGLAEAIQVDSRHVIQTMPVNYGNRDLIWISPVKRYSYRDNPEYINASFKSQVTQDIIHDVSSGLINSIGKRKYHYRYSAANNNKQYQTPSFLKF